MPMNTGALLSTADSMSGVVATSKLGQHHLIGEVGPAAAVRAVRWWAVAWAMTDPFGQAATGAFRLQHAGARVAIIARSPDT
jgi:hypothetical protein